MTNPFTRKRLHHIALVTLVLAGATAGVACGYRISGWTWGGLAWWTGGVAASLASHGVWTAMMLVRPPASGRVAVEASPG